MKLFDILPQNFFNILTSPNRQLYVDALFLLQDCFSVDDLVIRRDYFAERLREQLGNILEESSIEDDELDSSKSDSISDKASLINLRSENQNNSIHLKICVWKT